MMETLFNEVHDSTGGLFNHIGLNHIGLNRIGLPSIERSFAWVIGAG